MICAPVTSQQLWFPSRLQKWLCLGPGARHVEPEPARRMAGSNLGRGETAAVGKAGRRQSAPVPPSLAGAERLKPRAGVPALVHTSCSMSAHCRGLKQPWKGRCGWRRSQFGQRTSWEKRSAGPQVFLPSRLSTPPCLPVPASPCREWHPLDLTCLALGKPVHPGTGKEVVLPSPPEAPRTQGQLLLPTLVLGGRGAVVLMKYLMTATGSYYKHLSLIWIQATLSSFGSIKGPESGFQSHVCLLLDASMVPAWCKGASVSWRIRPCIFYTLL